MNRIEAGESSTADRSKESLNEFLEGRVLSYAPGSPERRLWGNALSDYRNGNPQPLIEQLQKLHQENSQENIKEWLDILNLPPPPIVRTTSKNKIHFEDSPKKPQTEEEKILIEQVLQLLFSAQDLSPEIAEIFDENVGGDPYHFEELLDGGSYWEKETLIALEREIGAYIELGKKMKEEENAAQKDNLRGDLIKQAEKVSNVVWPEHPSRLA